MAAADVTPEDFVEYLLVRTADRLQARFEQALRPCGLTPRQFSVLAVLRAEPGVTSADLARAVLVRPQSMGALVEQLERAGLVRRAERRGRGTPSPVAITPAGHASLREAGSVVAALEAETRTALGDGLTALRDGLDRINRSLDEAGAPIT